MSNPFPIACKNLLRCIDCPCFAEENEEAVAQFLSRFVEHIISNIVPCDLLQASDMKSIKQIAQEMRDMPEEQER